MKKANSFRDKFERYIARDRDDPDLRRKALTAITAKMARVAHAVGFGVPVPWTSKSSPNFGKSFFQRITTARSGGNLPASIGRTSTSGLPSSRNRSGYCSRSETGLVGGNFANGSTFSAE